MTRNEFFTVIAWAAAGFGGVLALLKLVRAMIVEVEDGHAVVVTVFGKLLATHTKPGPVFMPTKVLPWVSVHAVSLARDFRHFEKVHVNDSRGTTLMVDLWVEFRITEPTRALFAVEDWDKSLKNLVAHAASSILGNREFTEILHDRLELGRRLQGDIATETEHWGVKVERAFIRNVTLLPEVSQQVFEAIAARLERAQAEVEEQGRLAVAKLEADTAVRVASLVATAKGQYPAAVGRGLEALRELGPEVLEAYNSLYALNQLRPQRMVSFQGFAPGEVKAVEAAMFVAAPPAAPDSDAKLPSRE